MSSLLLVAVSGQGLMCTICAARWRPPCSSVAAPVQLGRGPHLHAGSSSIACLCWPPSSSATTPQPPASSILSSPSIVFCFFRFHLGTPLQFCWGISWRAAGEESSTLAGSLPLLQLHSPTGRPTPLFSSSSSTAGVRFRSWRSCSSIGAPPVQLITITLFRNAV